MNTFTYFTFAISILSYCSYGKECKVGFAGHPVSREMVGQKYRALNCARTFQWTEIRIEKWGISIVTSEKFGGLSKMPSFACDETISVSFTKGRKLPTVFYRKFVLPKFFKEKMNESEYNFRSQVHMWPCDKVPLQKFGPWKPSRKMFIELLSRGINTILRVREGILNGCDSGFGGLPSSMKLKEIRKLQQNERIIASALNHFEGIAYRNYICSSLRDRNHFSSI